MTIAAEWKLEPCSVPNEGAAVGQQGNECGRNQDSRLRAMKERRIASATAGTGAETGAAASSTEGESEKGVEAWTWSTAAEERKIR